MISVSLLALLCSFLSCRYHRNIKTFFFSRYFSAFISWYFSSFQAEDLVKDTADTLSNVVSINKMKTSPWMKMNFSPIKTELTWKNIISKFKEQLHGRTPQSSQSNELGKCSLMKQFFFNALVNVCQMFRTIFSIWWISAWKQKREWRGTGYTYFILSRLSKA